MKATKALREKLSQCVCAAAEYLMLVNLSNNKVQGSMGLQLLKLSARSADWICPLIKTTKLTLAVLTIRDSRRLKISVGFAGVVILLRYVESYPCLLSQKVLSEHRVQCVYSECKRLEGSLQ